MLTSGLTNGAPHATRSAGTPAAAERPTVVVYRDVLLKYNEPYIRTQAEAVPRYRSYYVGMHRSERSLALPSDRLLVLRDHYRPVDALLDRVVTRLPASGPLGALAKGSVVGRIGEELFNVYGVSPYLVRRVRALAPALVHAHTGVNGAHAMPLARRVGAPLVVTFHGYDATATDEELLRWRTRGRVLVQRRRELMRAATRVIAVSAYIRDLLLAQGWPPDRLVVHYMGVDTHLFRPDPAGPPMSERAPVVFFAGRLIEKKGLEYLIEAMRVVRARVPGAEAVVAGSGPLRAALEQRAAEAGGVVRFLGRVPPEEVRAWLDRAALFCMPSVRAANGDSEGLPTVVVEAMASGLPVVATTHAGIPEAVEHGASGLLAAERDVPALAEHLTRVLGDGALRARMGGAARARVLEHFDSRRQAESLADLYDAVRAEHPGRQAR